MKDIRLLKKLRVILAMLALSLMSVVFLDIYHLIPEKFVGIILSTQLAPSFINLFKAGGIVFTGFVVITVISLLVGRIYCSTLCPLGIFMDVLIAVKRKLRTKLNFKKTKSLQFLPYVILGLVILALLLGNIQLISLLDPYSNFGRILTVVLKPIVIGANNLIYDGLLHFENYTLQPIDVNYANLPVSIFVFLFFFIIIGLSSVKGRFFCTHICPVGSYLGLTSKLSVFKINIDSNKCISCGKCERVCKAGCISAKDKKVDFSKCVMCLNCISTKCPVDSIALTNKKGRMSVKKQLKIGEKQDKGNLARRTAIQTLVISPLLLVENAFGLNSISKTDKEEFKKRIVPISPPGSLNHKHFTESCTACFLCVNACPSNVIKPSLTEYGLQAAMLPQLTNKKGYCNLECTRCTDVCPNGALLPVSKEEKKTLQIGIAHFVREKCVVITDGTDCGACSEHCPTKAVNMVIENELFVPVVDESICIGCGACEYACPVSGEKAIFIEGNTIHKLAKKPKIEKLEPVNQEEYFPF